MVRGDNASLVIIVQALTASSCCYEGRCMRHFSPLVCRCACVHHVESLHQVSYQNAKPDADPAGSTAEEDA